MDWDGQDSDDEYEYGYEDDEDAGSPNNSDHDEITVFTEGTTTRDHSKDKNYTVLNEAEIRRRQDDCISGVSSVLSLSESEASLLLCYFNWNVEKLQEEWFCDEFAVRDKVGLLIHTHETDSSSDTDSKTCEICFDEFAKPMIRSLPCGHPYCVDCWKGYISAAINDTGSGTLSLKCPGYKCSAAVKKDLIDELASEDEKEKFGRFLVRSYVESRKEKAKWCPAPGCDHAIEFERGCGDQGYDVMCACLSSYCWNCTEEPHRPVECELVEKWILKNSSEAENTKWILAYSKPCPKCHRPIEKNNGCMHMTCGAPCRFEFCWLCLADWHSYNHRCNSYNNKESSTIDVDERMRQNAKESLERYAHYYERWASNHKSRQKAMEDLHRVETVDLAKLSDITKTPTTLLSFIVEGWKQIIECRRVLKWTYAYGYYLEEREPDKKQFFEYLQGQAEHCLERLHGCAERELSPFFVNFADEQHSMMKQLESEFSEYRTKLTGLTKVTGRHFEELVTALENGLSDVVIHRGAAAAATATATATAAASSSKVKGQKRKGLAVASSSSSSRQVVAANSFDMDYGDYWRCDRCTYRNPILATSCQICYGL